jgi:hypothetical protein
MGFDSRVVFPLALRLGHDDHPMAKRRSEVLADVGCDVLEIGFGRGLNLAHYSKHVGRSTTAVVIIFRGAPSASRTSLCLSLGPQS